MTFFYILLICICIYLETSREFNTKNLLNKLGLACIIVGSILKIASENHVLESPNNLIGIGVFLHFVCEVMIINRLHYRGDKDDDDASKSARF